MRSILVQRMATVPPFENCWIRIVQAYTQFGEAERSVCRGRLLWNVFPRWPALTKVMLGMHICSLSDGQVTLATFPSVVVSFLSLWPQCMKPFRL